MMSNAWGTEGYPFRAGDGEHGQPARAWRADRVDSWESPLDLLDVAGVIQGEQGALLVYVGPAGLPRLRIVGAFHAAVRPVGYVDLDAIPRECVLDDGKVCFEYRIHLCPIGSGCRKKMSHIFSRSDSCLVFVRRASLGCLFAAISKILSGQEVSAIFSCSPQATNAG
jgi:hypothetical protein